MQLVPFITAGGIPCYYAKINRAYEDLSLCLGSQERRLSPPTYERLCGALHELDLVCDGALGSLQAVVSGGAYVDKPGAHGRGHGYDIGGVHWRNRKLVCLDVAETFAGAGLDDSGRDLALYLAVESVLRKWFGTVLGMHFSPSGREMDHWNHWHVDDETRVGYWSRGRGSETRVRYLQETLTHVWQIPCGRPDGDEGPKTRRGISALRQRTSIGDLTDIDGWLQYLTLTALEALRLQ